MIDLHTHTTASDGTLSPTQLIGEAKIVGLRAIALTDHDTVSGIAEAKEAASDSALEVVPGVEISTEIHTRPLHIVGLYIDPENEELLSALEFLRGGRDRRVHLILEKLVKARAPIEHKDVLEVAKGPSIGRPHIAQALVNRGFAESPKIAFKRYLDKGRPGYVPKDKLDRRRAIEVIRAAGGVPILAHPSQTKLRGRDRESLVRELAGMGLLGIEAYCTGYSSYDVQALTALARKYELVVSGGSDFHGTAKPDIQLGTSTGHLNVPDDLLEPIREVASRFRN